MSNDDFAAPAAPGGGIDWKNHKGNLLLIEALEDVQGIQTSFGAANAVRANVTVIDGATGAEEYDDCLVFPKVLASQLRKQIGGKKVLGRLGQGNAKPGQSAPWLIEEASAEDVAKARAYLASLTDVPF
jgi:hypothetical protein